jgi:uncharacterized protein YcfL
MSTYILNKKLWFTISALLFIYIGCKSKQKSVLKEDKSEVMEHPKPAMEQQTDSLKRVLDEQRRLKKQH